MLFIAVYPTAQRSYYRLHRNLEGHPISAVSSPLLHTSKRSSYRSAVFLPLTIMFKPLKRLYAAIEIYSSVAIPASAILAPAMLGATMADARAFLARLEATTAIIAAVQARPEFDTIVEAEQTELLQALGDANVRGKEAADIICAVKAAHLPAAVEEALIARVAQLLSAAHTASPAGSSSGNPSSHGSGSGKRSSRGGANNTGTVFQDYTSIVNFIPAKIWTYTNTARNGVSILKVAVALGLRRGTESTYKVLSLCILCAMGGLEYAQNMEPALRTEMLKQTKADLLQVASFAGQATVALERLPSTPQDLKESQPELYTSIYNSEPPIPNPFDPIAWGMLLTGTKCRRPQGYMQRHFAGSQVSGQPMASLMAEIGHMRQDLRLLQGGTSGGSGGIQIQFPNRGGNAQPPLQLRALGAASSASSGAFAALALPPPPGAMESADAATAENGPSDFAAMAEQGEVPAGKRMGVAETTKALLSHMSKPMKQMKKRALLAGASSKKKKGRKKKRANMATAAEEAAPAPKKKAKEKGKAKGLPTIKYKKEADRFRCFYNKLPCKSFIFKKKAEMGAAKADAEDMRAMSPLPHTHLHVTRFSGANPGASVSGHRDSLQKGALLHYRCGSFPIPGVVQATRREARRAGEADVARRGLRLQRARTVTSQSPRSL